MNSWVPLRTLSGNEEYRVDGNPFDRELWFDDSDDRRKLLVVGNSHAKDIYNLFMASEGTQQQFQVARFGSEMGDIDESFYTSPNYLAADVVVFVSQYKRSDLPTLSLPISRALKDAKQTVIIKNIYEFEEFSNRTYADFLFRQLLQERGSDQISAADIAAINHRHYLQFIERESSHRILQSDEAISTLASAYPALIVLDRMDYTCDAAAQTCFAMDDQYQKYFYDYAHHTMEGIEFFADRIDAIDWLEALSDRR
jgi:hypothetical protein